MRHIVISEHTGRIFTVSAEAAVFKLNKSILFKHRQMTNVIRSAVNNHITAPVKDIIANNKSV
jgi:hypothetical protein